MFGKLLKYDIKETGRTNFIFCGIAAVLLPLNILLLAWSVEQQNAEEYYYNSFVELAQFTAYEFIVLISVVIMVLPALLAIFHYNKTSYGQAAYFTRLIPAKQSSIFHSKILTCLFWIFLSIFIIAGSACLFLLPQFEMEDSINGILYIFFGITVEDIGGLFPEQTKIIFYIAIGPYILLTIFEILMVFIFIFTAAQTRPFRKMGFGAVMIWVAILYGGFIVYGIISALFPWQLTLDTNGFFTIITSDLWGGLMEGYGDITGGISLFYLVTGPLLAIGAYFWCKHQYVTNINLR